MACGICRSEIERRLIAGELGERQVKIYPKPKKPASGSCLTSGIFPSAARLIMGTKRLEVKEVGDISLVTFVDKHIIDEVSIRIIGEQLLGLVDEVGRRNILLDFGQVEFISSPVLGKLIALQKKLQTVEGHLALCNLNSDIYEVFIRTNLDGFFDIQRGIEGDGSKPKSVV